MRFTFLGTSAGVPTRQRNVTALALAIDDHRDWYLVDCGEGTQQQLLHTRYSLARLRAIFITHVHGDHCYGLPGVIASANMSGRKDALTICAPAGIEEFVDAVRRYTDLGTLRFPLHFVRSDETGFRYQDDSLSVSAHALSHRVPSFAYRFEEIPRAAIEPEKLEQLGVPRGPLWGELQDGKPVVLDNGQRVQPEQVRHPAWRARVVVVGGDNDRPELLDAALRDSDVLIHEATFTDDVLEKVGPQYMHSTASMVGRTAQENRVPNLVLTHFSQRYRLQEMPGKRHIEELRREAREVYSGNLLLARDHECYQLQRDHTLIPITPQTEAASKNLSL